jgi:hypothetical protein
MALENLGMLPGVLKVEEEYNATIATIDAAAWGY